MRSPDVGLFVREDVNKPENRVNLALFGCLNIEAFRREFLKLLGLPASATIFPPQNVVGAGGSIRPDFCICDMGFVIGWIEVELGSNEQQLNRFRSELVEKVIAVWGIPAPSPSVKLREIGVLARSLGAEMGGQQRIALKHLVGVVDDGLSGYRGQTRTRVSEQMASSDFYAALSKLVGGIKLITNYNPPGFVYADTVSEKGFSIRVASPISKTSGGTVAVVSRSAGRLYLEFNSRAHLAQYLSGKQGAIEQLATLVRQWGANLDGPTRRERRVPLSAAEVHVAEIAGALRRLV